jgi:hypothetical protein
MLVWLAIGAASVLAIAGLWWAFGDSGGAIVRRELAAVGHIDVPKRLEGRTPDASPGFTIFRFDRVAGGFAFMGSITPVRERLVVVAWTNDRAGAIEEARQLVADRVATPRWRVEGDVERGEGTYAVNAQERASRLTLLVVESEAIVVAHRIWVEDSGPAESVDLVRRVAASFKRAARP